MPNYKRTLCDIVRQTAYSIHLYHGHGHFGEGGMKTPLLTGLESSDLTPSNSIRSRFTMKTERSSANITQTCWWRDGSSWS